MTQYRLLHLYINYKKCKFNLIMQTQAILQTCINIFSNSKQQQIGKLKLFKIYFTLVTAGKCKVCLLIVTCSLKYFNTFKSLM